jgi:2'-5' RNA ligase
MNKTWELFLTEKKGVHYDFSSSQVDLPPEIARRVIKWGKENIPDDQLKVDEDGGKGRENEIHVTVLYGLHDATPYKVERAIKDVKPFKIELGTTSVFTNNDDFDVVKIDVISPELHRINKILRDNCEYTNNYPDYKPHVTVAYVQKGKGWQHGRKDDFFGVKWTADEIIFSSKTGKKSRIVLGARPSLVAGT